MKTLLESILSSTHTGRKSFGGADVIIQLIDTMMPWVKSRCDKINTNTGYGDNYITFKMTKDAKKMNIMYHLVNYLRKNWKDICNDDYAMYIGEGSFIATIRRVDEKTGTALSMLSIDVYQNCITLEIRSGEDKIIKFVKEYVDDKYAKDINK